MNLLMAVAGWTLALWALIELRRREMLIRDAAHELRGPLGAVSLGLELLRRQRVSRRRADSLLAELARIDAAIDDVGAAARGRRAPARRERVELETVVARSSDAWGAVAERAGRSVTLDWPAGRVPVRADPRRLAQAFGNLLANAVEHGGGDIVVRGRPEGASMRVEVADQGSPGPRQKPLPGRGRGLVIAERALSEAGGRLRAWDQHGGGRVAVAELPLDGAA